MKIIIAPDKFKDSLTGLQFCDAVEKGLKTINPNIEIVKQPLADGGDGTLEVVNFYLKGKRIKVTVHNPLFEQIAASYLYAKTTHTAFIEMAEASGLHLLRQNERDCKNTTSFGTGELILDAINKGAKTIILGIGGSATNDCGIGMATAFGYQFFDEHDKKVTPIGKNLSKIKVINTSLVNPKLKNVTFKVACDVTNPLFGKYGAAYVYAKQKGANNEDIKLLDKGLQDFSEIINSHFNIDSQSIKGAGAAGGMGIGAMVFLNGKLTSGIELVKEISNFNMKIKNADWIITGEGKLDSQTLSGKTIKGVIESAKANNIKVAALCGCINLQKKALAQFGISYSADILNKAKNENDAMTNAYNYVMALAKDFAQFTQI